MPKIFQLELFIKEIKIWKKPKGQSVTHGEASIEVTVYDCKNVPIKRHDSGENSTLNSGQNFLFTLDEVPTDENRVFFNIFLNAKSKELVGTGKIPIHELFGDVFLQTFNDKPPDEIGQPPKDIKGDVQSVAAVTTDTKNKTKQNDSKTTQQQKNTGNTKNDSKNTQQKQKATGKTSGGNEKAADENTGNNQSKLGKQQQKASDATKNDTAPDNTAPDVVSMKNTKNPIPPPSPPISRLTKDIYPIMGTDSNQCGSVCILMRLTSFGNFNSHPIHIHQNHKEIIIQNTPNTAIYRRVPLDLRNNRQSEHLRYISSFPSNTGKNSLIYNRGPKVKDFSFQCNENDILKDVLQSDNSLVDQK